jgi:hypothetical protein
MTQLLVVDGTIFHPEALRSVTLPGPTLREVPTARTSGFVWSKRRVCCLEKT